MSDDAAANAYVDTTYLAQHNVRFAVAPAKSRVVVRETEAGSIRIMHIGRDGGEHVCAWTELVARPLAAVPAETPVCAATPVLPVAPRRPAPDHPWRRAFAQAVAVAQCEHSHRALARRAPAAHP